MKKIILGVFALLCAATLFYAGSKVYGQLLEYHKGTNTYEQMQEFVVLPEPTTGGPAEKREAEWEDTVQPEPEIRWPEVDFTSLKAVNPDIVGWLYCEGTVINYPVVQGSDNAYYLDHLIDGTYNGSGCLYVDSLKAVNPDIVGWLYCEGTVINYPVVQGSDNAYYLDHLIDGTYNGSGCLYVDCLIEHPFQDTHTVIYGHHMQNKTMFAALDEYRNTEFYKAHPQMLLMTPEINYEVLLYAAYVVGIGEDAWSLDFADEADKARWLQSAVNRSLFKSDVVPQAEEPIVTLSTCSYDFENARFVVQGILRACPVL